MIKECCFCGAMFEVKAGYRKMCSECRDVVLCGKGRKSSWIYDGPKNIDQYEKELRLRNIARHQDTIVAEGYAERQKKRTLEMVRKIKITL